MGEKSQDHLIFDETGTQKLVGYVIDLSGGDHARCWLDVGPQHLNRHGVLHGGIVTMLLDTASGVTGSLSVDPDARAPFLSVSLTVNFVAPGRSGRVTACGRVTGGGRSLLYIAAELRDLSDTLLATSSGVFKRVRAPEAR